MHWEGVHVDLQVKLVMLFLDVVVKFYLRKWFKVPVKSQVISQQLVPWRMNLSDMGSGAYEYTQYEVPLGCAGVAPEYYGTLLGMEP